MDLTHLIEHAVAKRRGYDVPGLSPLFALKDVLLETNNLLTQPDDPRHLANLFGVLFYYGIKKGWIDEGNGMVKRREVEAAAKFLEEQGRADRDAFIQGLAPQLKPEEAAALDRRYHCVEPGVYERDANGKRRRILIEFGFGLGDSVQLTIVLQHLKKYRPDWDIDLATWPGREGVGLGYCGRIYCPEPIPYTEYDTIHKLFWFEADQPYHDAPSTQPVVCLRDVFHIDPDPELMKYRLHLQPERINETDELLQKVGCRWLPNGRTNAVAIHYEGTSEPDNKNLKWAEIEPLLHALVDWGYRPVILDWRVKQHKVSTSQGLEWITVSPPGVENITALIRQCSLMVGIDSGPGHCAGATETPTLMVWTKHHPLQYYDLCSNVTHLVPQNHRSLGVAEDAAACQYFWRNYKWRTYRDLAKDLVEAALDVMPPGSDVVNRDPPLFRDAALDGSGGILVRKDWLWQPASLPTWKHPSEVNEIFHEDRYQTYALNLGPKPVILDCGAGIGAFAKRCHENWPDATIICIESDPANLAALRANCAEFAEIVHGTLCYDQTAPDAAEAKPDALPGTPIAEPTFSIGTMHYYTDPRSLPKRITIEQLMDDRGLRYIDLLKLDRGNLDKCRRLACIGQIIGHWDKTDWDVPSEWRTEEVGNDLYHAKRIGERPTVLGKRDLKVALAPGIGDSLWACTKIPALLEAEGCKKAYVYIPACEPRRSKEFLDRFSFISNSEYKPFSINVPPHVNDDGTYCYVESQKNWHRQFDWVLCCNGHLERGERLETWLPEIPTCWNLASHWRFSGSEIAWGKQFHNAVLFYLGPDAISSGHNRDHRWRPEDWFALAEEVRKLGLRVVVVGAIYDMGYYARYGYAEGLGKHECLIGKTDIGELYSACLQSKAVVAYQSGVAIWSVFLGANVVSWWRAHGDSLDPDTYISFNEQMAHCWTPPGTMESGRYLPLIYGKTGQVEQITNWLKGILSYRIAT